MEWTNNLVIKLMQQYEARPVLWDPNHELFRILTAKHDAWEELSTNFDIEISDLKKKLQSVLASHRRENNRVRAGGRSTWFLYPHMKFLPNHVGCGDEAAAAEYETETEADNQQDEEEDHMVTEYLEIPSEELAEQIIIKEEQDAPKKKIIYNTQPSPQRKKKISKAVFKRPQKLMKSKIVYNDSSLSSYQTQSKDVDFIKKKDECDSFGDYIATSLRQHDQRTRSMIKHAINNILFEQEMKKYSPMQYSLVADDGENPLILGDSENHEDL